MSKTIILADYGGPEQLESVKGYLKNMFSDREILAVPAVVRWFLARIIAKARSIKSQEIYSAIGGGSPVNENVRKLCRKLNDMQKNYHFVEGFRYSPPYIKDVAEKYREKGETLVFPIFPHYSKTTYLTIHREAEKVPGVLKSEEYYQDPSFLKLITDRIEAKLTNFDQKDSFIMLTAHSLPEKYVEKGDPYVDQVMENVRTLQEKLAPFQVKIAFQSRLGPVKWVGPQLEEVLEKAKEEGYENVLVYPLAFTTDNSETVYELDIYLCEYCRELGYKQFERIDCFNDAEDFCRFILSRVEKIL